MPIKPRAIRATVGPDPHGYTRPLREDVLIRGFLGLVMSYFLTGHFMRPVLNQIPGLDLDADILDGLLDVFAHGVLDSGHST